MVNAIISAVLDTKPNKILLLGFDMKCGICDSKLKRKECMEKYCLMVTWNQNSRYSQTKKLTAQSYTKEKCYCRMVAASCIGAQRE